MLRRPGFSATAPLLVTLLCCAGERQAEIGVVLPLTGPFEAAATSVRSGIEVAYERIQSDPELEWQVELELADSEGSAEQAAELAAELYRAGALAVIGGLTTEEALAMAGVSRDEGRVLLSPTALSDELSGISRTFFRLFPTALQQASAMANFATQTLDVEDLVILAAEDRAFTMSILENLQTVFSQYGGNVKEVLAVDAETVDLAAVVDQALALEPTGLYLSVPGPRVPELLAILRDKGFGGGEGEDEWIMTTSAFAHPAHIARAGEAAEGVYVTVPAFDTSRDEAPMSEFVTAYREKYGETPDLYAGHGYDSLQVLATALRKATSSLPAEFLKAMRAIEPIAGVTGNLQFDEQGNVQKYPRVHLVRAGRLVDFQSWQQQKRKELQEKMRRLREETRRLRSGEQG